MPQVVDWRTTPDLHAVVRSAVQALMEGQLVAFPTETVYGIAASAMVPEAVERLRQRKGRPDDKPLALAVRDAREALEWVPRMSPLGQRLARRCWPGPVTLVFGRGVEEGRARELAQTVRQRICPTGTLGLRVPDHDAILETLHQLSAPLVLTSANRGGEPAATTAAEVVEALGDELAVVIDDGPCRYS